jgi:hypothetical protein
MLMNDILLTDAQLNAVETIMPKSIIALERNFNAQARGISPKFSPEARAADIATLREQTDALQDQELERLVEEIDAEAAQALKEIDAEIARSQETLSLVEEVRLGRESTVTHMTLMEIRDAMVEDTDRLVELAEAAFSSGRTEVIKTVVYNAVRRLKTLAISETRDGSPDAQSTKTQRVWAELDARYNRWRAEAAKTSPPVRRQRELDRAEMRKRDVFHALRRLRDLRAGRIGMELATTV